MLWAALGYGALKGGMSFLGQRQRNQQAAARNRAKIARLKQRQEIQKRRWYQQLAVWNVKSKTQVPRMGDENMQAFWRGVYKSAVTRDRKNTEAKDKADKMLKDFLSKSKGRAGQKNQGASANRISRLQRGKFLSDRNQLLVTTSRKGDEEYQFNVEALKNRAISGANKLDASVAFRPIRPVQPTITADELESTGRSGFDWLNIAWDAWDGYSSIAGFGGGKQPKGGSG